MKGYLYKIENNIDHQVYIGKTYRKPNERWNEHIRFTNEGKDTKLYNAMRKFGISNFSFDILGMFDEVELEYKEIEFIKKYNSFLNGYNDSIGGEGKRHNRVDDQLIIDHYKKYHDVDASAKTFGLQKSYIKRILTRYKVEEFLKKEKPIAQFSLDGDYIKKYNSIEEIVDEGFDRNEVLQVLKGKKESSSGYWWSYNLPF